MGSAFLGPVGLSILLGLAAYAIAKQAKQQESSPLEQWARQCRWGTPTKQREWKDHEELDTAISCLNVAILGVTAHIAITANFKTIPSSRLISIGETYSIPSSRLLTYKISIPNFSRDNSRYEWILTTYKPNNKTPSDCYRGSNDDLTHDDNPDVAQTPSSRRTLIIEDSIALEEYDNIHAAELILIYWPDKFDSSGYARLQVKHDKLDLMEN
ncbi:hypothetical protein [Pseudomonas guariconensis]|uniref:hypothetical protein n=1 Tax=Pseudomonas guariconensis TaxID=1288410 RepID=UPI0018AB40A8|nr:hypothetical protein [Pseudomonas guariconensis]MBF8739629.1 hypothetical protein [Pseudomonas guariconensis]MBF8749227.1 hypothetical protein [Pseudomonas guariconensis]